MKRVVLMVNDKITRRVIAIQEDYHVEYFFWAVHVERVEEVEQCPATSS